MKNGMRLLIWSLVLALMLTACGGTADEVQRQTAPELPLETEPQVPQVQEQQPDATVEKATESGSQQEVIYQAAVTLLEQGNDRSAAGLLMMVRDYQDSEQLLDGIVRRGVQENAETFCLLAAVREDGTVAVYEYAEVDTSGWTDVVSVSGCYDSIAALRSDGTLLVGGSSYEEVKAEAESWEDIIQVCGGYDEVIGLRADGTVLSTDPDNPANGWTDIVRLELGEWLVVGLRSDGTVVCTDEEYDVSGWHDITDVAAGLGIVMGLRSDGTVASVGMGEEEVSRWTDIVAIDAYNTAMGLRADGRAVMAETPLEGWGLEDMGIEMPDLSGWRNVVAIDTWGLSFIGLRSDGTLLTSGLDEGGQLNVGHWRDIVEVKVENYTTVALRADGTVLVTGMEEEVLWTGIRVPEE